jgi:hypothetical protein
VKINDVLPEVVDGLIDQAYFFNKGNDDLQNYVSINLHDDFDSVAKNLTVSLRIKPNANILPNENGRKSRILEKENSFFFLQGEGGTTGLGSMAFFLKLDDGSSIHASFNDKLMVDKWYHLVGTYDGRAVSLFLNGILKQRIVNPDEKALSLSSNKLVIGSDINYIKNTRFFEGLLDDVRIYNRVLSDQEIKYLYIDKLIHSDK